MQKRNKRRKEGSERERERVSDDRIYGTDRHNIPQRYDIYRTQGLTQGRRRGTYSIVICFHDSKI